jgi:transcription initiation factor TFIID subunit 1
MMSQDSSKKDEKDLPQKNPLANIDITGKVLVIRRKVKNSYGEIVEKKETVRKPEVIEAYLKIRASKTDQEALRKYVQENSDEEKEKLDKLRRERRRLQEQIRRSKKNKRRIIEQSYGGDLDESEEEDGAYPVVRDNKLTISKSLLKVEIL